MRILWYEKLLTCQSNCGMTRKRIMRVQEKVFHRCCDAFRAFEMGCDRFSIFLFGFHKLLDWSPRYAHPFSSFHLSTGRPGLNIFVPTVKNISIGWPLWEFARRNRESAMEKPVPKKNALVSPCRKSLVNVERITRMEKPKSETKTRNSDEIPIFVSLAFPQF